MNPTPYVYFRCVTCKWRHDVPANRIAMSGGVPVSTYTVLHTCEGGADVEECGGHDAELYTDVPGSSVRFVL